MRLVIRAALLTRLALLSTGFVGSPADAQVVGIVTGLLGSASVQPSGMVSAPLALHSEVHEGDTVRTGPGARLRIALRDNSILSLGADGELTLDHLAQSSQSGARGTLLTLALGFLRTVTGHLQQDSMFQIRSPSMIAAVRGTDWIESYSVGKTEIFVAAGCVLATDAVNPVSNWVLLNPGEGVHFIAGAPHSPVVRWSQEKINLYVAATRVP